MAKLMFFDSTLRDGSHAVKHQFSKENIEDYCMAIDGSGMYTVIVGHGNGLGASSLQVGLSKLTDHEMIITGRENLEKTKLGIYMIPGFGTIRDDLIPAIQDGVDVFKIGCHCTEADTTKQHIQYLCERGKETYGVLMMFHMASKEKIIEEARKMQSYGAKGVILMDSSGTATPEMVQQTISGLCDALDFHIGFHAHNNMGMAVANAYFAIQEGATIIDGTLRGFGAGAGNCQLEALAALLEKSNIKTGLNLYRILDASEQVMPKLMGREFGQDPLSIVSGMSGVFSAFKVHVIKAASEFHVDPRDIFVELGKRKAVGGQEDMIIEIAEKLSHPMQTKQNEMNYEIGSLL
jgi:4-hydroxy 2-oxovalerate aldolase